MEKIILNKKIILFIILFFSTTLFAGNSFLQSKITQAELKLYFSSDIERITFFFIPQEDGSTKYVYDVHGGILPPNKGISHHTFRTVDSFRIAQNSPDKLRIVIKSTEKSLDKHSYRGNILAIPLIYGETSTLLGATIANLDKELQPQNSRKNSYKKRYRVVIDAGHGGKDNGASCCEVRKEKRVALSVANKLKTKLQNKGYEVFMTRSTDDFIYLRRRTAFANEKKADIFISVHANAAPNLEQASIFKGIEIYYLSPAQTKRAKAAAKKENSVVLEGKDYFTKNAYLSLINREKIVESHKLGLDVSSQMLRNIRGHFGYVANGGVKPANFWVLVGALMPAILVETGYITHQEEGANLLNGYYQKLLAEGIADGVDQYLKNKR
jgi:N-acetylmuramoyl-L-alanine amidase